MLDNAPEVQTQPIIQRKMFARGDIYASQATTSRYRITRLDATCSNLFAPREQQHDAANANRFLYPSFLCADKSMSKICLSSKIKMC